MKGKSKNMKETYFAKSEKEHYTFRAASLEDARHWVINHLDTSQEWWIGPISERTSLIKPTPSNA